MWLMPVVHVFTRVLLQVWTRTYLRTHNSDVTLVREQGGFSFCEREVIRCLQRYSQPAEGALLYLQHTTTGPYPKPVHSSPRPNSFKPSMPRAEFQPTIPVTKCLRPRGHRDQQLKGTSHPMFNYCSPIVIRSSLFSDFNLEHCRSRLQSPWWSVLTPAARPLAPMWGKTVFGKCGWLYWVSS